jgi:glycosyltransferase involved in cell wall biosynthesis
VSVLTLTCDHEAYVEQSVRSALMQETDFPVRIAIGEDCSTDRTRDIVQALHAQHPDRIRLVLQERNVGMLRNFAATLAACSGSYVAFLEGDDFWTDPLKLQRQVDYLEAHPGCALCFHPVRCLGPAGDVARNVFPPVAPVTRVDDLLRGNYVPACSVVMRRSAIPPLPAWFLGLKLYDWPLWVLAAEHGSLDRLPQEMATYRIHAAAAWSVLPDLERLVVLIEIGERLQAHYGDRHASALHALLATYEARAGLELEKRGARDAALERLARAFRHGVAMRRDDDVLERAVWAAAEDLLRECARTGSRARGLRALARPLRSLASRLSGAADAARTPA